MRGGLIVAILSLVFLVPAQALAQYCKTPCELDASGDSYLEADSGGDDNFGALRVLEVRRWTAAFRRRAVLRFDLSTIPPDATINTASVLLTIRANNLSSGSRDFNLHKIDSDRPWVETEVTWDDYIDSTPWTSGGGDYAGTASVSLELKASPPPHSAGQQTWSSPQLATDAQGFLSSPSTNQGWLLKQENDHQGAGQEVTFHSREATTPYDDDDKPKLTLTYTMTESAVDLISLSAARTPHGNEIHWRTGLEVDNVGFHIYRDVDGKRVRITQALITGSTFQVTPATTPTAAHSYTWLAPEEPDGDLGADDETKYWLQDIDLNGKSKWHGPVTPTPSNASSAIVRDGAAGSSPARTARGGQQRIASHAPLRHPAATPSVLSSSEARRIRGSNSRVWDIPGADSIKLIVDRDGWYRVDSALLFAAGLASHVDPRNLQLWAGGEEQPIRVFGEGDGRFDPTDSIEFQGRALDTRFTNSQTYWLVAGRENGRRFSSTADSCTATEPVTSYRITAEQKDRSTYFMGVLNGDADNFFGPLITAEPTTQLLSVRHLARSAAEEALLEVIVQGATNATEVEGRHEILVTLNDTEIGRIIFAGQTRAQVKWHVPIDLIADGDNRISLSALGGDLDISLLDTIRLTHESTFTAENHQLDFSLPAGKQATIMGFSTPDIRVVDITDPAAITELCARVDPSNDGDEGFTATITAVGTGERILRAVAEGHLMSPAVIESDRPSMLRAEAVGADLVIISPEPFLDELAPLVAARTAQGLSVKMVDIQDVYDEFSYGEKTPFALRTFLAEGVMNWSIAPRFVLLAGDASLDPRGRLGLGQHDLVSTGLVDTALFETASDDWFVDFDDDGVPEMAVGRLPARSEDELEQIVDKIVGQDEVDLSDSWANRVLFVADVDDVPVFSSATPEFRAALPDGVESTEVSLDDSDEELARKELLEALEDGQRVAQYYGHGSVDLWSQDLFTGDDVANLTNSKRLPVVLSFTCLNGFFHGLWQESLAERLLREPAGGATAVWASSGTSKPARV